MANGSVMKGIGAAALVLACAAQQQRELQHSQEAATVTAVRRGQFELGCPTATGQVLSSTMLEPVGWGGIERAEYTIGVSGCGKQTTYVVVCPENASGCVATGARNNAPTPQ
jgi:hypothetical protein